MKGQVVVVTLGVSRGSPALYEWTQRDSTSSVSQPSGRLDWIYILYIHISHKTADGHLCWFFPRLTGYGSLSRLNLDTVTENRNVIALLHWGLILVLSLVTLIPPLM